MAIEDGLILGTLLGLLHGTDFITGDEKRGKIHSILELFEGLRKQRTTLNVKGAIANRYMFHLPDGPEQEQRDEDLAEVDWENPCRWQWADLGYQKKMLSFDLMSDTNKAFGVWAEKESEQRRTPRAQALL